MYYFFSLAFLRLFKKQQGGTQSKRNTGFIFFLDPFAQILHLCDAVKLRTGAVYSDHRRKNEELFGLFFGGREDKEGIV